MSNQKNSSNVVPIIMMIALFGMISFVTNLAAPMGVVLKNQFGASNFEGLLGNAANFIAYAVMGIPGGIMLQKIGYKKTALLAIAIGFVGVGIQYLSGHAASFAIYLTGAFVAGFSMTLLNTVVNPMLNTLGGGGNKGNQLIQVGGSFNSIMATITPIMVGALIGEVTKANITSVFPIMYIALGIFAVAFVVMAIVNIPEPQAEVRKEPLGKLMSGALKFRHFILGAIGIFVYVGVEVGTPGTMILFLADPNVSGFSPTLAGSVAGAYWFLMLIGRLVGASIGGKVSSKTMLTVTSLVGLVFVLCAMLLSTSTTITIPFVDVPPVPIAALFIILVGLCTSIMWGSIFNLAVEGLGKYLAAASGLFMVLVCGGGILPALQGKIADLAGYMTSYWVIVAGLAYLLFYALIGSKNVNKDIPVE